jgi:ketosteroid isomerase-like protein
VTAPGDTADLLALRALVDRYASAVDARDADAFAALFTPDAALAVYEEDGGEAVVEYRGTAALREVMDLLRHFSTTFHLMANHLCAVDGDAASGEVYCMAHHLIASEDGETDLVMYIRYRDAYERTPAGWRFARRDVMRQWTEERPAARRPLDV